MKKEETRNMRMAISKIDAAQDLLENMKKLIPEGEDTVEVRLRGMKIKIPAKLVQSAVDDAIKEKEKEVSKLESELTGSLGKIRGIIN